MARNELRIGAFLSYAQMAISIIIGLIYTPYMIRMLGQSEFGLYNTVSSTIAMLSILNLGFNSSYIRYYAKYKKSNDIISIYKLNGLFLIIFTTIGIVAFICGVILSNNLSLIFANGLTKLEFETAKILMWLFTINLSISFPMTVFVNIIVASEKFIVLKSISIIKTIISPLLTIPLLFNGYGSIAMVIVSLSVSLVVDLIYMLYSIINLKQKFSFKNFESGLLKSIFTYTIFIAINIIVDQVNWNIDKLLLGRFRGTSAVAVYSIGFTLNQYYQLFSTSISGIFTPKIHFILANENNVDTKWKQITDLFVKVGRVQFVILCLIASGFVIFGKVFIDFWAGEGYKNAYYVALLLILPVSIALIQNLGIEIQRAQNRHKFRSIVYLVMAIINFVLSIFLAKKYGEIGSAVGTAISLIIANGIIMNIYYHKKCNINIILFWKNIIRMSFGVIIPFFFGIIIMNYVKIQSVFLLLLWILIYSLVYFISMFFLGLYKSERKKIITVWKKLFWREG